MVVNQQYGAFSKTILKVRKSDGCQTRCNDNQLSHHLTFGAVAVTNMFQFETDPDKLPPLIVSYSAIFNLTDVQRQCP